MASIYFKNLSGDIITIPMSNIIDIDIQENKKLYQWNHIRHILAESMNCNDSQIIIISDKDYGYDNKDDSNIIKTPDIIPEFKYNFFIRDKDYFNHIYISLRRDIDGDKEHLTITIYETQSSKEIINITFILNEYVKNNIYNILLKELNVPWYDKIEIADRIMRQLENSYNDYNDEYYNEYEYYYTQAL